MSGKEKAAPVCETESGSGQVNFDGFDPSKTDYTIDFQPGQGTISALLHRGSHNALTAAELARITDKQPREVRREIARERRSGAPIMSGPEGFYLASTVTELRQCARMIHRKAAECHRTAAALERIADAALGGGDCASTEDSGQL